MQLRTDLAIEAREMAGDRVAGTEYHEYRENGMKNVIVTYHLDKDNINRYKPETYEKIYHH